MYSAELKQDAKAVHNYLKVHGWTKHTYKDSEGKCCLVGAMRQKLNYFREIYLRATISKITGDGCISFNDSCNTFEEVEKPLLEIINN